MLTIDREEVEAVLLHDGWHSVHEKSFRIDSIEIRSTAIGLVQWRQAAIWEEVAFAATVHHKVTVPFESILAFRELKK